MMKHARWLVIAAALLLSAGAAHAQQSAGALSASKDGSILRIKNAPTVVMWARGFTDAAEIDTYVASGFNTVYVMISGAADDQVAAASALMSAAESRGLYLVAAILPTAIRDADGEEMAPDPTSSAYAAAVSDVVKKLAEPFGRHANLLGWSIEAVVPNSFTWSDDLFRAYLSGAYQDSIAGLNASWGTAYDSWDNVTMSGAADVDSDRPGGVGRARADLALYRQASYADALDLWAQALRAADPGRLVFASALTDYRSIISVRTDFDGLILNTYPSIAEQDFATHNVHAVDIARRANQFAAIPTLWVDSSADANRLANWMNQALLHGATGLALSSWSAVKESEALQAIVKQTADASRSTGVFPARTAAGAAILYEPFAGGAVRNGQGLYGYIDGLTPDEPTSLFAVTRAGTRYGLIDVLSRDSLDTADLSQYGVIFAPMAFYLTEDEQIALHGFVLRGGALMVDAGIGMYQGDGTVGSLPPVLTELLGMRYSEIAEGAEPGEYGSLGQPGQVGQPGVAFPVGPGEVGLSVDPDIAKFADILGQFLGRPDVRKYLGEGFIGENGPGFRVRGLGRGFTVYAPTFLYASWDPGDPYFNDFHERMLSWQYDLQLVQPDALWPSVSAGLYAGGAVGVASPGGSAAIVDVYGAKNRLYWVPSGAIRLPNPEEDNRAELLFPGEPLAVARPLPIYVRTFDAGAVVTVTVVKYDSEGIELLLNGVGAAANASRDGIHVTGGGATNVEVEIHDGLYRLARGSTHHVALQEGPRGRTTEEDMMPNSETGLLVMHAPLRAGRLTIAPAPSG